MIKEVDSINTSMESLIENPLMSNRNGDHDDNNSSSIGFMPEGEVAPLETNSETMDLSNQYWMGTSMFETTANFANSIIGAGIISLPYAMKSAGLGIGLVLVLVISLIVDWSIRLLVQLGKMSNKTSYQSVMLHAYGRAGFLVLTLAQFLFAMGAMIAYLVIIGNSLPAIMLVFTKDSVLTSYHFWIVITTIFIILPLSFLKDIGKLGRFSIVSLLLVIFIVLTVSIEGSLYRKRDGVPVPKANWRFANVEVAQAAGVISFAFVAHHNTFLLYNSLSRRTIRRFSSLTHYAVAFSLFWCFIISCAGYGTFFDETRANILTNFECDNVIINMARVAFTLTMFLTYPLEFFVARATCDELFFPNREPSNTRHIIWTLSLVGVSMGIALSTSDLGIVIELTGDVAASIIAYICPALCYLQLASGKVLSRKKIPAVVLVVFGVLIMIVGTGVTIYNAATKESHNKILCVNI